MIVGFFAVKACINVRDDSPIDGNLKLIIKSER